MASAHFLFINRLFYIKNAYMLNKVKMEVYKYMFAFIITSIQLMEIIKSLLQSLLHLFNLNNQIEKYIMNNRYKYSVYILKNLELII